MNAVISTMLERYACRTQQDYKNALKEIIQELALFGLWRSKFFEKAAFYGGTALRILYGLDRFSEDLDFSLLTPDTNFSLGHYTDAIETELRAVGFDLTVTHKDKNQDSTIQSAFIKAGTLAQFLHINVHPSLQVGIHKDQMLKIKLELDINPPAGFFTEAKILLHPIPFSVLTYQKPDLFAGKLHAVLCRPWMQRVKGRDWYDLVWYIAHHTPVRLNHLRERLLQSKALSDQESFDKNILLQMLQDKINQIDFESAKKDILPFIRDKTAVDLWSQEFFAELIKKIVID